MFCKNCGREVAENSIVCPSCGCAPAAGNKFCRSCGAPLNEGQIICVKCGVTLSRPAAPSVGAGQKDRTVAGLLAIFLGCYGAHKFYLGRMGPAVVCLVVSLVLGMMTCGLSTAVMAIVTLIEGIIILTKSDEEFHRIYVVGQQDWF